MKRKRKRTINENRVMSFARFFALKMMTAKQIGKYCGCCGQSASKILNGNGVFRMPMVSAVDKLVIEGFSFNGALKTIGVTMGQYAHNLKVSQNRQQHKERAARHEEKEK